MTQNYSKIRFDKEELEWAISLIEKEYNREDRNTPLKMSALISSNFDVICDESDIQSFFKLENYEQISNQIEFYG